jgi:TolB-like protein/Tfp pilus assembly protein PilF
MPVAVTLLVVATVSYPLDRWIWQRWHHSYAPIRAIAVLPLENFSNDPSQEYFSDGMTEALITELGHVRSLRVISRQSALHFKGTTKTVPQIGDELQVDALVEGSALRDGDKVRISVQLVRVNPEEHVWAQSYEREFRDVIALQREVSNAIVSEIQGTLLTSEERTRLATARPVKPEAYEAYLKGRFFWYKRSRPGFQAARAHFEQALALDPEFAPAYSGLADTIMLSSEPGHDLVSFEEANALAKPLVMKALELDPDSAEAHASLAYMLQKFDRDYAGAERELRRAIELDPNNVFARHRLFGMLFDRGLTEEALAENRRALAIDPLSPLLHSVRALALQWMRHDDEALRELQAALEVDPDFVMAHIQRALFFERHGKLLEAIHDWEFDDGEHYGPEKAHKWAEQYREALEKSGPGGYWSVQINHLQEYAKDGVTVRPWYFARAYAYRGDRDRALEWLSKPGGPGRTDLLYNPDWDSLRSDPRFQELQKARATPK